jgi:hypothetical protein
MDKVLRRMKIWKSLSCDKKAAICGHYIARHNLGSIEERKGRIERAAKHWVKK